jgi:hypothetical protein
MALRGTLPKGGPRDRGKCLKSDKITEFSALRIRIASAG